MQPLINTLPTFTFELTGGITFCTLLFEVILGSRISTTEIRIFLRLITIPTVILIIAHFILTQTSTSLCAHEFISLARTLLKSFMDFCLLITAACFIEVFICFVNTLNYSIASLLLGNTLTSTTLPLGLTVTLAVFLRI